MIWITDQRERRGVGLRIDQAARLAKMSGHLEDGEVRMRNMGRRQGYDGVGFYSAVDGSMRRRTAETRLAGMPVRLACSRIVASSGAR